MKMTKCRICDNEDLELILDLGYHPPSDAFLSTLDEPETYFPLRLMLCEDCGLAQLDYVVSRETLFNEEYPYMTGVTPAGVKHFREFVEDVEQKYGPLKGKCVMDVGSNDGTLLEGFKAKGCIVYGIEPCEHIAQIANEKKIPTRPIFFDSNYTMMSHKHFPDIITATNVFAHVDKLHEFMDCVDHLLTDDGVFIIEAPSFDDMIEFKQFDQIYHEHLSYLSPKPIAYLAEMHGFKLDKAEHNDMHGGSYRYFICRK